MNSDGIEYIKEEPKKTKETKEKQEEKQEEFINSLPDWDLVPPYEVIRRNIK